MKRPRQRGRVSAQHPPAPGTRFFHFVTLDRAPERVPYNLRCDQWAVWCRCDCGREFLAKQYRIHHARNPATSCGCMSGRDVSPEMVRVRPDDLRELLRLAGDAGALYREIYGPKLWMKGG